MVVYQMALAGQRGLPEVKIKQFLVMKEMVLWPVVLAL